MDTATQTRPVEGPPPDAGVVRTSSANTAMREAMLNAIGELSDEERSRLSSAEQPDDMAQVWRDLVAERAAREREATVRTELTREFESRTRASQPRPTRGLRGGAPPTPPGSVAEWTEFIRSSGENSVRQARRAQFADWLATHPDA